MGKFRYRSESKKQKEQADEAQKETNRLVSGWLRKCIESGQEWADEKHRQHVALARSQITNDLMEICEVGDPANIDYNNPHVKIQLLMCDPVNQRLAHNPKLRQRLYDKMDDETLDVWMNFTDDYGHTYRQFYESKLATVDAYRYRRRMDKQEKKQKKSIVKL